jgi:hypothetical protein
MSIYPYSFLIGILLLIYNDPVLGQSYTCTYYGTDQGLPSNESYSVVQDLQGYIWVSTDLGVTRYDGLEFKTYGINEGLHSTVVYKLLSSPLGGVVFYGSDNYVGIIKNDSVSYFLTNSSNQIGTIYGTKDGIVVGYRSQSKYEIYNWEGDKLEEKEFPDGYCILKRDDFGLIFIGNNKDSNIIYIEQNVNHNSLDTIQKSIGSGVYLTRYQNQNIIVSETSLTIIGQNNSIETVLLSGVSTSGGFIDSKGRLWQGLFDKGINVISLEDKRILFRLLDGYSVSSIIEDNEGTIWVTTLKNGLVKLKLSHYESILEGEISKLIEFDNQLIAVAYDTVLLIYDLVSKKQEQINVGVKMVDLLGVDDKLYVSVDKELNNQLHVKNVEFVAMGSSMLFNYHEELLGIMKHRVIFFKNDSVFDNSLNIEPGYTYFTEVEEGQIYVGRSGGLYRIYKNNGKYQSDKIISEPTTCIDFSRNGTVIGTKGYGVLIASNGFSVKHKYTSRNGLTGDFISTVQSVGDTLVCSTNNGIDLLVGFSGSMQTRIYSSLVSNGLWSKNVRDITIKNHDVYVATENGVQKIALSKVGNKVANPKPIIEHINGKKLDSMENIIIDAGTNNIKVDLGVISFHESKNFSREYRLLGRDTIWKSTASSEIEFINLSPGQYELQFRVKFLENTSYSIVGRKFELIPLFIQTIWFRIGIGIIIFGIVFFVINVRDRYLKERNNMLLFQEQLRYKSLTSQLNPHFIFNALGSIQNLIITGKNNLAAEYLATFSDLLDKTLRNTNQLFILLSDEVAFIEEYIKVEKSRFEKPFIFNWYISKEISKEKTMVPTMFLQPYIENSIIHGINPLKKMGRIDVTISVLNPKVLEIKIVDNGVGVELARKIIRKRTRKSMAMENIRMRLQTMTKLYEDTFNQNIRELMNEDGLVVGTEVVIEIPYKLKR